jgi:hypothetical protein
MNRHKIREIALRIWSQGIHKTMNDYGVAQGIMMFIIAAILLAILLPVLNGVMTASPILTANPLAVGNMTSGGVYIPQNLTHPAGGLIIPGFVNTTGAGYGTLTTQASIAASQQTVFSTIGSSYGLLIVVLIIVAASVILGAIALFKYFGGQD